MFKLSSAFDRHQTSKSLCQLNHVLYVSNEKKVQPWLKKLDLALNSLQQKILSEKKELQFSTEQGHIFINLINIDKKSKEFFSLGRDFVGPRISQLNDGNPKKTILNFEDLPEDFILGAVVGLELAAYRFDESKSIALDHVEITIHNKKLPTKTREEMSLKGLAINHARHLVNLPPNHLHPVSFAKHLQALFKTSKTIKVEVWDEKRLTKEKCGLHLGVGAGSMHPPRLVKLSYKGSGKKKKKVALVGKGITFDTGGLDIKPAAGMRLMKKDMGGAAAIAGFFVWLEKQKIAFDIEGYLALAENSIDERATRPSDIHIARNGLKVEIDNTDAEGRLVLADAIDVACDQKPDLIIDAATLTGAGKVALGQDIYSLFCNNDDLAKKIIKASIQAADPAWRMPLYQPYAKELSSSFADCVNSSSGGFGGSITAALFLEKFVRGIPWAHFDIFAWTTSNQPALIQKGGSGQGVGTLIEFFS